MQISKLVFVALVGWMVSPASAQATKYFGADITPTSVLAGSTGVSLALSILNCNNSGICSGFTTNPGTQAIKSAKVQIPPGFTVSGTPGYSTTAGELWTVSVVGSEIQVVKSGSAALSAGESLTLNITANASCTAGANPWTTTAFNDDVFGTAFTLVGTGTQTVNITGTCGVSSGFLQGDYCGYSQGGWGSAPHGNNPGQILALNFGTVYASGLTVGNATNSMTFTTSNAVDAYLPAGSTPDQLIGKLTDPTSTSAGVFGGQVLALRLNVDFNGAGIIDGTQGSIDSLLLTGTGGSLDGHTVAQILATAQGALGGGGLPSGYTFSTLNDLIDQLNTAFDNCVPSAWAQTHLTVAP